MIKAGQGALRLLLPAFFICLDKESPKYETVFSKLQA